MLLIINVLTTVFSVTHFTSVTHSTYRVSDQNNNKNMDLVEAQLFKNIYTMLTPGDGHCLLHSIRLSWINQCSDIPPSLHELKCSVFLESINNYDTYVSFLPQYLIKADYTKAMRAYILNKHYNSPFGDAAPVIIANSLNIKLEILDFVFDALEIVPTNVSPRHDITIYKHHDHFSGIGFHQINTDSSVPVALGGSGDHRQQPLPVVNNSHPKVTCSASVLHSLRSSASKLH
jgi:hypothetical protein